jgi:hypothetical protein
MTQKAAQGQFVVASQPRTAKQTSEGGGFERLDLFLRQVRAAAHASGPRCACVRDAANLPLAAEGSATSTFLTRGRFCRLHISIFISWFSLRFGRARIAGGAGLTASGLFARAYQDFGPSEALGG